MQSACRIIVEVPGRRLAGSCLFAVSLVRELVARGRDATILRTEPLCEQDDATGGGSDVPAGVLHDRFPAGPGDSWGQRWDTLERYLEERAPCVYVMSPESLANRAVSRLSSRIRLVVLVHSERSLENGDIERLAPYCDFFVAVGQPLHFRLVSQLPQLACRTVALGQSTSDESGARDANVDDFLRFVARLDEQVPRWAFVRPRGNPVGLLRADIEGQGESRVDAADFEMVGQDVPWPDPPSVKKTRHVATNRSVRLEDHKVIVASMAGVISGVDVFATHLVRGLRSRGIDARLHGRRPDENRRSNGFPPDLPFDSRDPDLDGDFLGWMNRWRLMVAHLERLAPCIYVPNYDADFSCVAPLLPDGVRVVGIGHSDDPWHYEHLCRIGHACDAIVGVSHAISEHLRTSTPGGSWAGRSGHSTSWRSPAFSPAGRSRSK